MSAFRRPCAVLAAVLVSGVVVLAGCGPSTDGSGPTATTTTTGGSSDAPPARPSTPPGTPADGTSPTPPSTAPQEETRMQLQIAIGTDRFTATLDESAAGRDLVALLPLTLDMSDHGSVEKTGRLPAALSLEGQPSGADPDVGDLGYYAPGRDLVLYYGDQSYYEGIVVLGRLDADAADRLAQVDGSVTATITATTTATD